MTLPRPYHPLLVAAFPVLFVLAHNVQEARMRDAWLPLGIFLAAAVVLWCLFGLFLRRIQPSALATSLVLLLFSSYGHVFMLLKGASMGGFIVGRTRFLLPLWLLLMVAGVAAVFLKRNASFTGVTRAANLFSAVLVAVSAGQILLPVFRGSATNLDAGTALSVPNEPHRKAGDSALPDIYYIIPDSYGASSTLADAFGLDNAPFENALRARGFFVASQSRSNYTFTSLSLASSLNMSHLDFLVKRMGEGSADKTPANRLLADNAVMRFLKGKGYTVINAGSWWGPTHSNRGADINLSAGALNEFSLKVLEGTMLYPFAEDFEEEDLRRKVLATFRNLGEIPRISAPTFTLAHVICPHPPYIFGPNGERVPPLRRILHKADSRALYRDQVIFMNRLLLKTVDHLLAASPRPPVIIIQGDHGAAYTYRPYGASTVFPDDSYLTVQMRIFNAYYLPGAPEGTVYDSITPVNSFRAVLNAYFGANLPLLPDESFYSTKDAPYRFTNVTRKVLYP